MSSHRETLCLRVRTHVSLAALIISGLVGSACNSGAELTTSGPSCDQYTSVASCPSWCAVTGLANDPCDNVCAQYYGLSVPSCPIWCVAVSLANDAGPPYNCAPRSSDAGLD